MDAQSVDQSEKRSGLVLWQQTGGWQGGATVWSPVTSIKHGIHALPDVVQREETLVRVLYR